MALVTENTAMLAPMPSARVSTETTANPGDLVSCRIAYRMSCTIHRTAISPECFTGKMPAMFNHIHARRHPSICAFDSRAYRHFREGNVQPCITLSASGQATWNHDLRYNELTPG